MLSSSSSLSPSSGTEACRNILERVHASFSGRRRRKRLRRGVEDSVAATLMDHEEEKEAENHPSRKNSLREAAEGEEVSGPLRSGSRHLSRSAWFVSLHQHKEEERGRKKAIERRQRKRAVARGPSPSRLSSVEGRPRGTDALPSEKNGHMTGKAKGTGKWMQRVKGMSGREVGSMGGQTEKRVPMGQGAKRVAHSGKPVPKHLAAHLQRLQSSTTSEAEGWNSSPRTPRSTGNTKWDPSSSSQAIPGEGTRGEPHTLSTSSPSLPSHRKTYTRGPDGRLWTLAMARRHQLLTTRPTGRRWTPRKLATLTKGVTKARVLLRYYQDRLQKRKPIRKLASPSLSLWCTSKHCLSRRNIATRESLWQRLPASRCRRGFFLHQLPCSTRGRQGQEWGLPRTLTPGKKGCEGETPKTSSQGPSPLMGTEFHTRRPREEGLASALGVSPHTVDEITPEHVPRVETAFEGGEIRSIMANSPSHSVLLQQCEVAACQLLWDVLWKIIEVRHRFVHDRLSCSPSLRSLPSTSAASLHSSSSFFPQSVLEARAFPLFGLVVDVCEGVVFQNSAGSATPSTATATSSLTVPTQRSTKRNTAASLVSVNPPPSPLERTHLKKKRARRAKNTTKMEMKRISETTLTSGSTGGVPRISRGIIVQETARYVSVILFPEGEGLSSCLPPSSTSRPVMEPTGTPSTSSTKTEECLSSSVPPTSLPPTPRVVHVKKLFPCAGPGTLADVCQLVALSSSSSSFSSVDSAGRKGGGRTHRQGNKRDSLKRAKKGLPLTPFSSTSLTMAVVVGEYWEVQEDCCHCHPPLPSPSSLLYDHCL